MDAPDQLQTRQLNHFQGDGTINRAEIARLLQEVEELSSADMPLEKPSDPQISFRDQPYQQGDQNQSSKGRKNSYSKWYRKSKKEKLRQLQSENSFYKQQIAKIEDVIMRLIMCDAQLDREINALMAAYNEVGPAAFVY